MIDCENLEFSYRDDGFLFRVDALAVDSGERVALVGPSGCGKTTLLNLLAGILVPRNGSVRVNEQDLGSLPLAERQAFRVENIGMIPQNFELLDYLTVRENILLPFRISSALSLTKERETLADELADRTGIRTLMNRFPEQLSQGERQRAAICRGLVTSPRLILADEPTGNLDPENQDRIVSLLLDEGTRLGATILMITHELELVSRFDRSIDVLQLRKGGKE